MQTNPSNQQESFEDVLSRRLARRDFVKGAAAAASMLVINEAIGQSTGGQAQTGPRPLTFTPIELSTEDRIIVPRGYSVKVLLKWGDPLFPDAPGFNLNDQSAASQERQFGYNPDFIAFLEFPRNPFDTTISRPEQGLLWVNHEYTNPELMFPGYSSSNPTRDQVDIELAAHGGTVVQIERRRRRFPFSGQEWAVNVNSPYNRRTTAETLCQLTGPAAGHALLKTKDDETGTLVHGTLNNCAGGVTPWNTIITAEENFNQYFANLSMLPNSDPRKAQLTRYGLTAGASERKWERFYDRFDISKEPNEAFRFGYVVEIDPFNPKTPPKKRTALGRFKHEAATFAVGPDQRVAVYTGDDERFDYMYKFITKGKFNPAQGAANGDLLDEGTLYAAKFNDDGTGVWLPLVAGQGALANWTQAEICINTRLAADLVGPTKMDRPEDIEPNPVNGKVYAVFTNNTQRGTSGRPGTDKANPRANNTHGHIIELTEKDGDPTSTEFTWDIFMLCGNPNVASDGTYFAGFDPSRVSPISSPDNIMFDKQGNMWISTDGQIGTFRMNDGIYVVPTEGPERGFLRQLLSGVPGGELAGPALGLNDKYLFASIQHPAEGSPISNPVSKFPDGGLPRPAVLVVENAGGSRVIGA